MPSRNFCDVCDAHILPEDWYMHLNFEPIAGNKTPRDDYNKPYVLVGEASRLTREKVEHYYTFVCRDCAKALIELMCKLAEEKAEEE
jgi:hypothetical protein